MVDARGKAWAAHIAQVFPRMARIAVRPTWVGLLDFETRFPSGLARAMGVAGSMASAASVALLIT